MLKVSQPPSTAFHNFKCGEVFCISPAVYNVTCSLCATKMHLDQFPIHFQMQHLTLAEESINLEELELKCKAKLPKDANLLDNMIIKEEDPEDDPIKQEEIGVEIDEDDKSLQQLLRDKKAKTKAENEKQDLRVEATVDEFNIGEKLEVQIVMNKRNTRNSRKNNLKASTLKEIKKEKSDEELVGLHGNDIEGTKNKVDSDINKNENLEEDYDDNDVHVDKDWSVDDKILDTESESEDKNYLKDELPFPCHTCKRSYRSKHSLQKHNYSVHNPNKPPKKSKEPKAEHKCDQCSEVFRSARDLRGHKWKHTGIFCDICGKPFTQTGNMTRHKIRHTGIKAHKCKECDKEFFTDKELKSHMICHTGLMPVICEICGKRCRDRGVLTAHMRRHTGERPAKCDVCGKSFFSFHDLNVHAVTHSSERPFKCDICGSTFQRKKALRVHKLIHSKDRKHVCKICGKGFAQSGGLNSHMRTHDAALEKSTNGTVQQTVASVMPDCSSSHIENESVLSTAACKTPNNTEVIKLIVNYYNISEKMLKISQPPTDFHNFKCGEVFCISPIVYNVACSLCASKMHIDQFPSHFQTQHLTLAEESINLEELELKCKSKMAKDENLIDNMIIKEEDPVQDPVDPIKQEELEDNADEDDTSLQKILEYAKKASDKTKNDKRVGPAEQIIKRNTRNSRKRQISSTLKEIKGEIEENENKIDVEINQKDLKAEHESDDADVDKDWSPEDKISDTDCEPDYKDYLKDEDGFDCHTCKRSYSSKRSLQKHNYSVHNPNKPPKKSKPGHKCNECSEVFRSIRELRGHKWKHTGIFCDICGKPFTKTGNMNTHKIRHTGIKAHKCTECGKDFFLAKELKAHMISHTGIMPHICEICGKRCRDGGVLSAHMRRHTGERPAKCDVCGKCFFSFHDLNVHAVTHSSERPFKCDICGSTFQLKKALRVHKRIHTKDRNHICKICGKGFSQSGGLHSHMSTHDAAFEKTTIVTAQQMLASVMPDSSGSQPENQSVLSTADCIISNNTEVSMDEYMI